MSAYAVQFPSHSSSPARRIFDPAIEERLATLPSPTSIDFATSRVRRRLEEAEAVAALKNIALHEQAERIAMMQTHVDFVTLIACNCVVLQQRCAALERDLHASRCESQRFEAEASAKQRAAQLQRGRSAERHRAEKSALQETLTSQQRQLETLKHRLALAKRISESHRPTDGCVDAPRLEAPPVGGTSPSPKALCHRFAQPTSPDPSSELPLLELELKATTEERDEAVRLWRRVSRENSLLRDQLIRHNASPDALARPRQTSSTTREELRMDDDDDDEELGVNVNEWNFCPFVKDEGGSAHQHQEATFATLRTPVARFSAIQPRRSPSRASSSATVMTDGRVVSSRSASQDLAVASPRGKRHDIACCGWLHVCDDMLRWKLAYCSFSVDGEFSVYHGKRDAKNPLRPPLSARRTVLFSLRSSGLQLIEVGFDSFSGVDHSVNPPIESLRSFGFFVAIPNASGRQGERIRVQAMGDVVHHVRRSSVRSSRDDATEVVLFCGENKQAATQWIQSLRIWTASS